MKKNKTLPSKRDLIVIAASKLFLRDGYKATSIDAIVREAGVSKPTLYSHFQNKELLFAKIACGMCNEYCDIHCDPDVDSQPELDASPEVVLKKVGQIFLNQMVLQPQGLAMLRMALSESPQFPELGQSLWETGPNRLKLFLSGYLAEFNRREILNVPDPNRAALQFIGLAAGPYLLPILLGVQTPPQSEDLNQILDQAIAVFLEGYRRLP